MEPKATELLHVWFGDSRADPHRVAAQSQFWFEPNSEQDEFLRRRFGFLLQWAARGDFETWKSSAQSCLALVIIFDQLPRNLFRGRPEAFAYDDRALAVSQFGVEAGYLQELQPIEQLFLLMSYQHSESLSVQYQGVSLFEGVIESSPDEWKDFLRGFLAFARQHLEIVARFGRFPHRNAVLGRSSTPEEVGFLRVGGPTFGQSR
jgi:uncharacterized protein (DUF924 family)